MIHIFFLVQIPNSTSHVCTWTSLVCGEVEPKEDMPWTWQESAPPVSGPQPLELEERGRQGKTTAGVQPLGVGSDRPTTLPKAGGLSQRSEHTSLHESLPWFSSETSALAARQAASNSPPRVFLRCYNSPQGHKVSLLCWHQRGCPAGGKFNLFLIRLIPDIFLGLPGPRSQHRAARRCSGYPGSGMPARGSVRCRCTVIPEMLSLRHRSKWMCSSSENPLGRMDVYAVAQNISETCLGICLDTCT